MAKRPLRKEINNRKLQDGDPPPEEHGDPEEPTGPAEREEDVVVMGENEPSAGDPPPRRERRASVRQPADDGLVEVNINGVKRRVDPELAELLQAQETSFATRLADVRRASPASVTPERRERQPEPDFFERLGIEKVEEKIFTDPKLVLKKVYDLAVSDTTQRMTGAYTQDQQYQRFMNDFYDENPDLRSLKAVVESVLNTNVNELSPLSPSESRKRLSELVRSHIDMIVKRAAPEDDDPGVGEGEDGEENRRERRATTRAERPSGERQATPRSERRPAAEETSGGSISDFIRKRRRERQSAKTATR